MIMRKKFMRISAIIPVLAAVNVFGQNLSFVAAADNRDYIIQYKAALQEVNDMSVNPIPSIPRPLFFISTGDFDPVESNMEIYNDTATYPNLPPFYPVVGNHEFETPSDMNAILNILLPDLQNVVNWGEQGTYAFDHGNVHCIVLDLYNENPEGEVDADLLLWLQEDLNTTTQDHVFVFAHEPAFPRYRHLGDALDQYPESRNAFWRTLVIDPRVRAYFCGHTHYFNRMRVRDPSTAGTTGFPDDPGGLFQVDVGNIGNALGDGKLTLVYISVESDSVRFRAVSTPRLEANWSVADEWSIPGTHRFPATLYEPLAASEVSGNVEIQWSSIDGLDPSSTTSLYVSSTAGARWDTLWSGVTTDSSYLWDTTINPDGTRYMVRIVDQGHSGFGMDQSEGVFTVNNPGNALPEISLQAPAEDDTLLGIVNVEWTADDADGDVLTISLETSFDKGVSWQALAVNEPNDGLYEWDTQLEPNSSTCQMKVKCTDGAVWQETVSRLFRIKNSRIALSDTIFRHIEGGGGGTIIANIVDETQLTDHMYRLSFDDTTEAVKTYDVFDINEGINVVEDTIELDGLTEGPLFDGMRLVIFDYTKSIVDESNTGWTTGSTDLTHSTSLPVIDMGSYIINGVPYPADYRIEIFDHVVDTSNSYLGAFEIPIPFTVMNVSENRQVDLLFVEIDNNEMISPFDEIYILEEGVGDPVVTWRIFFSGDVNYIAPAAGDIFELKTLKPFTGSDVYEFSQNLTGVNQDNADIGVRGFQLYQNYPNPFNHETGIAYYLPFLSHVSLRIYNVLGQEVNRLVEMVQPPGDKMVRWNGKDSHNKPVDSGLYVYSLKLGDHIIQKKMIFIK